MKTFLARVAKTISLRGHKFPAGMIVRVWRPSGTWQIQPYHLPSQLHEALWYSVPEIHAKNFQLLEEWEDNLAELGFFN
jgi:hypothetical protein